MKTETPPGLRSPSSVLAALNGQHHITDTTEVQGLFYGFFVNPDGAVINTLTLDPAQNTGDLTFLDGATLDAGTEYIIPGIWALSLTSGSVTLYKA